MAKDQSFDIPPQLRELAEKNVEQASAAYGQFMKAMTQVINMWWGAVPPNEMTAGFKAVQDKAVRFAKQNAEAGFTLASSLSPAPRTSRMCWRFKPTMPRARCRRTRSRRRSWVASWQMPPSLKLDLGVMRHHQLTRIVGISPFLPNARSGSATVAWRGNNSISPWLSSSSAVSPNEIGSNLLPETATVRSSSS